MMLPKILHNLFNVVELLTDSETGAYRSPGKVKEDREMSKKGWNLCDDDWNILLVISIVCGICLMIPFLACLGNWDHSTGVKLVTVVTGLLVLGCVRVIYAYFKQASDKRNEPFK